MLVSVVNVDYFHCMYESSIAQARKTMLIISRLYENMFKKLELQTLINIELNQLHMFEKFCDHLQQWQCQQAWLLLVAFPRPNDPCLK